MQTLRPPPSWHGAAGELVHDHDLVIAHQVVHIALEQGVRPQGGIEVVQQGDVAGLVEAIAVCQQAGLPEHVLGRILTLLREKDLPGLLINVVIARTVFLLLLGHPRHELVHPLIQLTGLLGLP